MLNQRRRRCTNIKSVLSERLMFSGRRAAAKTEILSEFQNSFYIWAMPNRLILQRNFKLFILARFCKTLFLPEFLSNHYEIWTPYSQSSQVFCYDFSKTAIFRIIPGFSGSLYSWMAKGSFCLLVKWADTALCCSSNAKGSICLLARQ